MIVVMMGMVAAAILFVAVIMMMGMVAAAVLAVAVIVVVRMPAAAVLAMLVVVLLFVFKDGRVSERFERRHDELLHSLFHSPGRRRPS